jgi:hypothetical protein
MSFFSFTKIGEQEGRTGPVWEEGWYQLGVEKGPGGVNMVKELYTHVCRWKNGTC